MQTKHQAILLFDGYCNFCSSTVQFIIKHEKTPSIHFASLQSDVGKQLLLKHGIDVATIDSLVFIENNNAYVKSTAALRISKYLKLAYPLLYAFIIVPTFIRNWVYNYIAKNRYKWFGKSESCMLPSDEQKQRFL